jgi:hypothetical protein
MELRVRLRNGDQYVLAVESHDDVAQEFEELAAGRGEKLLRDWVRVLPDAVGQQDVIVRGDEIVEIQLVDPATAR